MPELKLFVWEEVLTDYSDGLAVAVAPDLETALAALDKKAGHCLELPVDKMTVIDLKGDVQPAGWFVHGGG
jgi:hypothetical protein